jgi:hypothetical protein
VAQAEGAVVVQLAVQTVLHLEDKAVLVLEEELVAAEDLEYSEQVM